MIFEKIDIREILSEHFKTLRDEDTDRGSLSDILVFWFIPIAISFGLLYFDLTLGKEMINILIASLSIFVGLLLNLLMLLMGMLDKCKEKIAIANRKTSETSFFSYDVSTLEKRKRLLKDTYHNISFAILLSLISIPVMIVGLVKNKIIIYSSNFIGYIFLFIFLFTLFMILKRVHVLLSSDV